MTINEITNDKILAFSPLQYHVRSNPAPATAKLSIVTKSDPVNEDLVLYLAENLGDEWFKLAYQLNICHSRIQAIIRNAQAQDQTEDFAKYQMIMTWLKRAPKASNKVKNVLKAVINLGICLFLNFLICNLLFP